MQHTLVAVFDNRTDAQNAMNELLSSNFSRQDVRLSNADPTGMTDSVTGASASYTNDGTGEGIGASIKHFFTDLFGADNSERASRYEGAVTRGHHVLTVSADSLPEVERAADIVERYGPTDIDEQASGAGATGMAGMPESMRMSGAGGMQQSASMSAQSAAPLSSQAPAHGAPVLNHQLDDAGDRKLFAQQSLNQAEPMGQTYQEPMGKSGLSATGGTSFQGSTLQENSVQGSSLDGTQGTDVSFDSSGQQGGTIRGSSLEGSAYQGGAAGAQQRDARMDSMSGSGAASAMRSVEIQRGKSRIYSPQSGSDSSPGLDMGGNADDDTRFRSHYDTHLSSSGDAYDDYKPAYSYGAEMRKSQLYRNQPWDDIEGDMRRGWDSRIATGTGTGTAAGTGAAVGGAWDKMKAAVRHGWESMTGHDTSPGSRLDLDDDDTAYRNHWNATYSSATQGSSYDEYKPAYSYGSEMAQNEKYRGRQWNEVENDLRTDWDSRYGGGGQSTWEKMKSAVRHGWDRMTS